jgi:uncharacterized integral membrane protein
MPATTSGHQETLLMRKFLTAVVLIPLAVIIIMFAVANRAPITVSFDPFDPAQPALALKVPMFVLVFILVGVGVVIGGVAAWLRQHRWRSRARRAEAEARDLRERLDAAGPRARLPSALDAPPLAVPPSV